MLVPSRRQSKLDRGGDEDLALLGLGVLIASGAIRRLPRGVAGRCCFRSQRMSIYRERGTATATQTQTSKEDEIGGDRYKCTAGN